MRRLLSCAILVALLTSCSGMNPATPTAVAPQPGATDTPSGEGDATISFAVWDYERPTYQPLAEKFMAENPGISVVLVPLDDLLSAPGVQGPESSTAMLRRIVSGADTAPAIGVSADAYGTPLLLDLKPLMDADPNFKRDDFYPGAIERWSANGGTWALPRFFYLQVLSYNRDLFKLANLPEPKAGWTWDDLLAAAEQIAAGSSGVGRTYGYLDNSGGFLPLLSMLKKQGLDLTTVPATELRLDDPRLVESLDRVRTLQRDGVIYQPYPSDNATSQPVDPAVLVTEGRLGIWGDVYIPGPNGEPTTPEGIDVGRVPLPADSAEPWGGPNGEGYMISGGTAYPNESWKWIEWLSRQTIVQPGQASPSAQPGQVPARQSLAEQTGFWETLDEQAAAAYRWTLANPAPLSERTPDYLTLGAVSQAVSAVVNNPKADTAQALDEAQKYLDEQLAQLADTTPTPGPDTDPVLVATPEPQIAPEGATTITFAVPGYGPSEMRRIVRAFREEHPEIFVQIKSTDIITGPPQLADVARSADCFTWGQPPQSDAELKALLDLQPLLDADASFPLDDYPPAVLSAYQRAGATYGLPLAFNLRTLTYNRTLFDAAGIEVPNGGWSTQDFLAAAQALTSGEGDQRNWGYVALGGVQQDLLFFIGQFGGRLTSGSGTDLRPSYTDPKTVEAIRWYIDLDKTHKVIPPIRIAYERDDPGFEDKSYQYMQEGHAAMWFDVGYGVFSEGGGAVELRGGPGTGPRPIGPERPFDVGVSPLPVGSRGLRSGDITARGVHISAGTQQAQACWEWLKFLSSDTSTVYADYPARSSVATGAAFTAQASPERLAIYKAYADVLKRPSAPGDDPYVLYSTQIDSYWLFKAIMDTVNDKADLTAALDEAQRFTNAYAECVASGETPAICAPKVDPDYRGYNVEDPGVAEPMG